MVEGAVDLAVISACVCGACRLPAVAVRVPRDDQDPARPVRCHCARCRKFHTAAYAALLPVESGALEQLAAARTFPDHCASMGEVERMFCGGCHSVLATRQTQGVNSVFLAMGALEDSSIPPALVSAWRLLYAEACLAERASWWSGPAAEPSARPPEQRCARVYVCVRPLTRTHAGTRHTGTNALCC